MSNEGLDINVLTGSQLSDSLAIPVLSEIKQICEQQKIMIIVLDDDPTGTQTIFDIPVITKWHEELIADTMKTAARGFFILTNTRSLSEKEAVAINVLIAQRVKAAAKDSGFSVLLISRSDSTLRGHFPAELHGLEEGWASAWDGFILMPYFKEGGRYTINNIHYVCENNRLIPAAETSFARDPVFGYTSSDLKQYINEKTNRGVKISEIIPVTIEQLNSGVAIIEQQLDKLANGKYAIVNGTCSYHAAVFALAFLNKWLTGKRYLVRCSASLVQAFFGIAESKLLDAASLPATHSASGGLIVVGSFVSQTTLQLQHLLANTNIMGMEIDVERLSDENTVNYIQQVAGLVNAHLKRGTSMIIYTSRTIPEPGKSAAFLETGNNVSDALVDIIKQLACRPKFLAAKGGITSSVIGTRALGVEKAIVLGQLMPGIPVWGLGGESKFPGMAYIIIPGNVGPADYLTILYNKLENEAA